MLFLPLSQTDPRTLYKGTTVKGQVNSWLEWGWSCSGGWIGSFHLSSLFPNTWNPWPWCQGAGKPGGSTHNICDWEGETPTPFTTTQAPVPVIFPLVTAENLHKRGKQKCRVSTPSSLFPFGLTEDCLEYQLFPCTQESFFFFSFQTSRRCLIKGKEGKGFFLKKKKTLIEKETAYYPMITLEVTFCLLQGELNSCAALELIVVWRNLMVQWMRPKGKWFQRFAAPSFSQEFVSSICVQRGFPGGSDGKESACNAGGLGLIPVSGRSPGEGNPLQYSCPENSTDKGGWWATVHGVANRWTLTKNKQAQATNTSIPSIPMWPEAGLIPRAGQPVGIIESRGFVGSEHFEFIETNRIHNCYNQRWQQWIFFKVAPIWVC